MILIQETSLIHIVMNQVEIESIKNGNLIYHQKKDLERKEKEKKNIFKTSIQMIDLY